jgi:hypothetical protein
MTVELPIVPDDPLVGRCYIEPTGEEWTTLYWTDRKEHGDRSTRVPTAIVAALRKLPFERTQDLCLAWNFVNNVRTIVKERKVPPELLLQLIENLGIDNVLAALDRCLELR